MGFSRPLVVIAAFVLLAAATLGLVNREDAASEGPAAPGRVQIAGFVFGPAATTVAVGTTVTWSNSDSAAHTVTGDGNVGVLDSGAIGQGATYTYTFDTPGTYTYYCAFHPVMKGSVEVTG